MSLDSIPAYANNLRTLDFELLSFEEIKELLLPLYQMSSYQALGIDLSYKNTWHRGRLLEFGEGKKK